MVESSVELTGFLKIRTIKRSKTIQIINQQRNYQPNKKTPFLNFLIHKHLIKMINQQKHTQTRKKPFYSQTFSHPKHLTTTPNLF